MGNIASLAKHRVAERITFIAALTSINWHALSMMLLVLVLLLQGMLAIVGNHISGSGTLS